MAKYLNKSLRTQIRETELQVLKRRKKVNHSTSALVHTINREMTSPASLLLAAGIGFIIGELTRPSKRCEMAQKPHPAEMTPLKTTLKFITLARTIYTVLPLAWIMDSISQKDTPRQTTKRKSSRPAKPAST